MAKRLIDADEIENLFYAQVEHGATDLMDAFDDALQDAPTIDAAEVIRCRNCIHDGLSTCPMCYIEDKTLVFVNHDPDFYCGKGEHKGGQAPQREDV